jgi:uncharacterized protein YraI
MKKPILSFLLATAALIAPLTLVQNPVQAETVCTKSTALNVRSGSGTRPGVNKNPVIWKLYKGTYINIIKYNSNFTWAYISVYYDEGQKKGWIDSRYICG